MGLLLLYLIGGALVTYLLWNIRDSYLHQGTITKYQFLSHYSGVQKDRYHTAVKKAHELLSRFHSDLKIDHTEMPLVVPTDIVERPQEVSHSQLIPHDKPATSDVVIGMAQKTDPKNLVVFCASLRKFLLPLFYDIPQVLQC